MSSSFESKIFPPTTVIPKLDFKISKKIAQLTKVIYMFSCRIRENEKIISELRNNVNRSVSFDVSFFETKIKLFERLLFTSDEVRPVLSQDLDDHQHLNKIAEKFAKKLVHFREKTRNEFEAKNNEYVKKLQILHEKVELAKKSDNEKNYLHQAQLLGMEEAERQNTALKKDCHHLSKELHLKNLELAQAQNEMSRFNSQEQKAKERNRYLKEKFVASVNGQLTFYRTELTDLRSLFEVQRTNLHDDMEVLTFSLNKKVSDTVAKAGLRTAARKDEKMDKLKAKIALLESNVSQEKNKTAMLQVLHAKRLCKSIDSIQGVLDAVDNNAQNFTARIAALEERLVFCCQQMHLYKCAFLSKSERNQELDKKFTNPQQLSLLPVMTRLNRTTSSDAYTQKNVVLIPTRNAVLQVNIIEKEKKRMAEEALQNTIKGLEKELSRAREENQEGRDKAEKVEIAAERFCAEKETEIKELQQLCDKYKRVLDEQRKSQKQLVVTQTCGLESKLKITFSKFKETSAQTTETWKSDVAAKRDAVRSLRQTICRLKSEQDCLKEEFAELEKKMEVENRALKRKNDKTVQDYLAVRKKLEVIALENANLRKQVKERAALVDYWRVQVDGKYVAVDLKDGTSFKELELNQPRTEALKGEFALACARTMRDQQTELSHRMAEVDKKLNSANSKR